MLFQRFYDDSNIFYGFWRRRRIELSWKRQNDISFRLSNRVQHHIYYDTLIIIVVKIMLLVCNLADSLPYAQWAFSGMPPYKKKWIRLHLVGIRSFIAKFRSKYLSKERGCRRRLPSIRSTRERKRIRIKEKGRQLSSQRRAALW